MIKVNDTIYPISNVKKIVVDEDNLSLTYYFIEGLKIAPIAVKYNSLDDLKEKVKELTNEQERKPKRLFG